MDELQQPVAYSVVRPGAGRGCGHAGAAAGVGTTGTSGAGRSGRPPQRPAELHPAAPHPSTGRRHSAAERAREPPTSRPDRTPARLAPRPSVLSLPRHLESFLYWPHLASPYLDAALRIAERECPDVGVRAWPDAWVYPIHVLSRSAGSTANFRNVDVTNGSARFAGSTHPPCLLLQLGPDAATPPPWASHWSRVSAWNPQLGLASVAVFAPEP